MNSTIFQMIEHLHHLYQFSVQTMCHLFHLSKSSYYASKNHKPSHRDKENERLKKEIMTSYLASAKRYGAPKIDKDLLVKGYSVSIKRVQKLMKTLTIHLSTKKEVKEYPNLLKLDFSTDKVNEKWVTDITYIYTLFDG